MAAEIKICDWKEVWRLTNTFNKSLDSKIVIDKLNYARPQFEEGLNFFKKSSEESFSKLKAEKKDHEKVVAFIEKLHEFLNLDAYQTWDLFSYFLSSQFHGKPAESMLNFNHLDIKTNDYLLNIWKFYNSERFFMMKTLKLVAEFRSSPNHILSKVFDSVIDKIGVSKLKRSLIKQFEMLIKELPPTKHSYGDTITPHLQNLWIERNLREQLEVLSILLLIIDSDPLSVQEFKDIFTLFKLHNFGRQPIFYKELQASHQSTQIKIVYTEVAIFYKLVYDTLKSSSVNSVIENIKDDVEGELVRLQPNEEHGAFLLVWMLLLLEDPLGEEMFITKYQHFGTKALQLKVFEFLHKVVTHTMFSDDSKTALILRRSVFEVLSLLCDKLDNNGSMAQHAFVIDLCNELLKEPELAANFWSCINGDKSIGTVSLWNTALEFFPHDFVSLSKFVCGLSAAGADSFNNLMTELNSLPMYTDVYDPKYITVANVSSDIKDVILKKDYLPNGDRSLLIKAKTEAVVLDRRGHTLIHFRTSFSFWQVLQNEIEVLLQYSTSGKELSLLINRIYYGVKALSSVLTNIGPGVPLPEYLVGCCESVFEILIRFSPGTLYSNTPLLSLISACLDVITCLVPNFADKIYSRLRNVGLLPHVDFPNLSHENYVSGESFHTAVMGLYLVNMEQPLGEYKALVSYLDLLLEFYECNHDEELSFGVLLPGVLFVLREVLPQMLTWPYKSPEEKQRVHHKSINFIYKVLQLSPEQTSKKIDLLMNRICVFSLLNTESGVTILKLISSGETGIQTVMENDTNWMKGVGLEYIKTIQISMSILMQVLRLKHSIGQGGSFGMLEHFIYTQPNQKDSLRVIPTVTRLMNHVFNPHLPSTACRLLRRFALEFRMSLLVCLDMTPQQIRTMFLERLRDETESVLLKTVILEFVAACIDKQPGLTEAFFKISTLKENKDSSVKSSIDGILAYMAEYLSAVKEDTNSLYSPLLSRIMVLFHALWKNNMQMLVKDLRENKDFWEFLCSPLFQDILPGIRAYAQIFNMIGIEQYTFEGQIDQSLKSVMEKLFSPDGKYLKKWVDYIFTFEGRKSAACPVDEVPNWLEILSSWKDLLTITIKFQTITITHQNKSVIVKKCLDALISELPLGDNRTIVILAELYVIYFSNWKDECFDDKEAYLKQIGVLLNHTAENFENLHSRAKSSILALCTLSLNMIKYDFTSESDLILDITHSICQINNFHLDKMFINKDNADLSINGDVELYNKVEATHGSLSPVILGLRLLEQCINVFKNGFIGWSDWISSSKLINKLLFCVSGSIQNKHKSKQTIAILNCLTSFARCASSQELLHANINQSLWLQLLPPKELMAPSAANKMAVENVWSPNEWWRVYKCGIELVTALLSTHGVYFASEAILFVGIQEDYLIESILLMKQTFDIEALNLTAASLYFVSELIKFESLWQQEHQQSLLSLMRSICICLHYCITLLLRPKGIHLSIESPINLANQEDDSSGPSPKVTAVLNKLLELMHLSAVCLKAYSPDLISLMANPCPKTQNWHPLMELQFGAPKLSADPYPQLTFGTVMSAVCFLTRSLHHNYHPEEIPLNSIRKVARGASSKRRIAGGILSDDGSRRRAYRSDSVTSLSSTTSNATIGPSWLAVLDKKLVLITLETILTLLASQALLAAKDSSMSNRDKQLVRRELCTEMPIFHDFVRKKVLDLSHTKNYLARKKFGAYPLLSNEDEVSSLQDNQQREEDMETEEIYYTPPAGGAAPQSRKSLESMRVSVVRKLHLDKAKTKVGDSPDTSGLSPIQSSGDSPKLESSINKSGTPRSSKHVTWEDTSMDREVSCDDVQESDENLDFYPLTEVQIIEEDYFHFLSNVFLYFCQTEH